MSFSVQPPRHTPLPMALPVARPAGFVAEVQANPRVLIPNAITAAGGACALAATGLAVTGGNLDTAGVLIVVAACADAADGGAAVALNACSHFGKKFDSVVDGVAYGVAPSAMVMALGHQADIHPLLTGAAVLCVAESVVYRLWRFDHRDPSVDRAQFQGLASPAGGGLIGGLVMLAAAGSLPVLPAVGGIVVVSGLMASTMPTTKIPWRQIFNWRNWRSWLGVGTFTSAVVASAVTYGLGAPIVGAFGGYTLLQVARAAISRRA